MALLRNVCITILEEVLCLIGTIYNYFMLISKMLIHLSRKMPPQKMYFGTKTLLKSA